MPLILAIEPTKSQAQQLASLVKHHLKAEIVTGASAEAALKTLGDRIPDLVLTPALLSSKDEAALTERLRSLGPSASHVQTLAVPILSSTPSRRAANGGLLGLRRDKLESTDTVGCEPEVFADQIKIYLERAAAERAAQAHNLAADERPASPQAASSDADIPDILDDLWLPVTFDDPAPDLPAPDSEPEPALPADLPGDTPNVAVIATEDMPVLEARAVLERASVPPAPRGDTRAVEMELGLLSPATSSPPLWRVAEGLDPQDLSAGEETASVFAPAPSEPQPAEIVEVAPPPAPPVVAPPAAKPASKKARAAKPAPPPLDDWAYFDPSQSPFKALIRRLDEIAGQAATL